MTDIPTWALEEAVKRLNAEPATDGHKYGRWSSSSYGTPPTRALARLIAKHEKEPADPLLIEARNIAASFGSASYSDDDFLSGKCDEHTGIKTILAALRRGIEMAGGL